LVGCDFPGVAPRAGMWPPRWGAGNRANPFSAGSRIPNLPAPRCRLTQAAWRAHGMPGQRLATALSGWIVHAQSGGGTTGIGKQQCCITKAALQVNAPTGPRIPARSNAPGILRKEATRSEGTPHIGGLSFGVRRYAGSLQDAENWWGVIFPGLLPGLVCGRPVGAQGTVPTHFPPDQESRIFPPLDAA
jgi:hypothetical protein